MITTWASLCHFIYCGCVILNDLPKPILLRKKNISMSPIFKISTFCQQRNVPNFFVIQTLWSSIYSRNVTYLASQCSVFSKPHPHLTCHVHTSFFNWRTYSISTLPDAYNMAFYILYLVAFQGKYQGNFNSLLSYGWPCTPDLSTGVDDLEFVNLLPLSARYWNYRCFHHVHLSFRVLDCN